MCLHATFIVAFRRSCGPGLFQPDIPERQAGKLLKSLTHEKTSLSGHVSGRGIHSALVLRVSIVIQGELYFDPGSRVLVR